MLKRYLLFMINEYDPCGGWDDLHCSFDTLPEAIDETIKYCEGKFESRDRDYAQIIDIQNGKDVTPVGLNRQIQELKEELRERASMEKLESLAYWKLWQEYEEMFGNSPLIGNMSEEQARPLIVQALKSKKPIIPDE